MAFFKGQQAENRPGAIDKESLIYHGDAAHSPGAPQVEAPKVDSNMGWQNRVERASSNGFFSLGNTLNSMLGNGVVGRAADSFVAGQNASEQNRQTDNEQRVTKAILQNKNKKSRENQLKNSLKQDQTKTNPFQETLDYYKNKDYGSFSQRFVKNLPEGVNTGVSVGMLLTGSPTAQAFLGSASSALGDIAGNRNINWKNALVQGGAGFVFGKLAHGTNKAGVALAAARETGEEITPFLRGFGSKTGQAATRIAGSSLIQGTAQGSEAALNHTGSFKDGFKQGSKEGAIFGASFEGGQAIAPALSRGINKAGSALRDYKPTYAPGFVQVWGELRPHFEEHILEGVAEPGIKADLEKNLSRFKDAPGIAHDWKDALAEAGGVNINKLDKAGIFAAPERSSSLVARLSSKRSTRALKEWVSEEVSILDPNGKDFETSVRKLIADPSLASKAPKLQKLLDSQFGIVHPSADVLYQARPKSSPEAMREISAIKEEIKIQHGEEGLRALYQEINLDKPPVEQLSEWYKARIKSEHIKNTGTTPQEAIGDEPGGTKIAPHKTDPDLIVNVAKNPKSTTASFRVAYSEVENRLKGASAQIAERMKKLAPKEMEAVDWSIDAKGDLALLEKWSNSPKLKEHRADILQAMNLSEGAQKASDLARDYYSQVGEHQKDLGILGDVRDNYSNRIIKKDGKVSGVETGVGLKRGMRQSKSRVYNTKAEGIENGVTYATHNAADLLQEYGKDYARFTAQRQLVSTLENTGLGSWTDRNKVETGYKAIEGMNKDIPLKNEDGKLTIGDDGNQMVLHKVFAVPDYMQTGLKAITETSQRSTGPLAKLRSYQAMVKSVDLSVSLFHHLTMVAQTAYQTDFGIRIPSLIKYWTENKGSAHPLELNFLDHGGITTVVDTNYEVMKQVFGETGLMEKMANTPGLKTLKKAIDIPKHLSDKNHEFLFGNMQRWAKVADFSKKLESWKSSNPNATEMESKTAGRGFAREINAAYGGLNWKALGISPSVQRSMRALLLAPDWTYSNVELAKLGFGDWGKKAHGEGTGGSAARAHMVSALIGASVMTEMLNKVTTGGYTYETNAKGHEMDWQVRPGIYISLFRGGIGDFLKLISNVVEESNKPTADGTVGYAEGAVRGTSRFLQGKLSPLARSGAEALTQTDFYGNPLYDPKKSTADNVKNEFSSIGLSAGPIPFGVQPTAKQWKAGKGENPVRRVADTALVATGIGRPGQTKQASDANKIYQDTQIARNAKAFKDKEVEKQIQSGDLSGLQGLSKNQRTSLVKAANKQSLIQSLPQGSKLRELMYDSKQELKQYAKDNPEDASIVKTVQTLQERLKKQRS